MPFSLVILLGALLASNALWAQAPANAPAPKPASLTEPGQTLKDVAYVTNGHSRQKLDVTFPMNPAPGLKPLVVWVHGGGWSAGSKEHGPAMGLLKRGYVVASINYRLSGDAVYPAQIEDCKAAIRWLRAHASALGIDPERIGVWGSSAGGHLVALLGLTGGMRDFDVGENLDQSSAVACVLDWFGPTDFEHYGDPGWVPTSTNHTADNAVTQLLGCNPKENLDKVRRASPITFVQPGAAPFLIMHGERDPLVPPQQSELLQAALKKAGVECTLKIIPGALHGGPQFTTPEVAGIGADFFDRHLKPSSLPSAKEKP